MAWPNVYTYNFCSNPSFEQNTVGVVGVNGAVFSQDYGMWNTGSASLNVTTPGQVANEGVILPPGTVLASGTGAVSFFLQANTPTSTGTLNVFAVDLTTSTTLGSITVSFDATTSWQRIQIPNLALLNTHNIAVYVETSSIQATSFNIDSVQYEPSLTLNGGLLPTPYIDGDDTFGFWVGVAEASASYKLYQNQISAYGDITTSGYGSLLVRGGTFKLVFSDPASGPTQIMGNIDLSGKQFQGLTGLLSGGGIVTTTGFTVLLMFAGMNDFAIFSPGDIDPAISLVGYNNAGIASGTNTAGNAGYTRPYATFSAPQAFTGSTAKNIWNNAAYFAVGYQFSSVAANNAQNISHVQAELVPANGGVVTPSTYIRPRALTAVLAPTQINYITNPSMENDTVGWTGIPSTTISRVTTQHKFGVASLFNTGTANHIGSYINVPNLIVGETYTVSGYYLTTDAGNRSITLAVNPNSSFASFASAIQSANGTWQRISLQFTAPTSSVTVAFWATSTSGSVLMNWYLDGVMLNPGGLVPYGDGSTSGWNFEGAAGDSRSYYYQRGNIAYAAIQQILASHLPLGLHANAPVYNTPVTQYN
jgi:hypothetical protein